jgi:hypothetical protein
MSKENNKLKDERRKVLKLPSYMTCTPDMEFHF